MEQDQIFLKRCIALALESYRGGDLPFGALVVHNSGTIFEAKNTGLTDITGHAEVNVIKTAMAAQPDIDFSECTLYTNFEPCAMCSFVIRDVGVGKVVFAVDSPHLGGYSKWNILTNDKLRSEFTSKHKAQAPVISRGLMNQEAKEIFDELKWQMHKHDERTD